MDGQTSKKKIKKQKKRYFKVTKKWLLKQALISNNYSNKRFKANKHPGA